MNILLRLSQIADDLEEKGFVPEADQITGIMENLTNNVPQETEAVETSQPVVAPENVPVSSIKPEIYEIGNKIIDNIIEIATIENPNDPVKAALHRFDEIFVNTIVN